MNTVYFITLGCLACATVLAVVMIFMVRKYYLQKLQETTDSLSTDAESVQKSLTSKMEEARAKAEAADSAKQAAELAKATAEANESAANSRIDELKAEIATLKADKATLLQDKTDLTGKLEAANSTIELNRQHEAEAKTEREAYSKQQLELIKKELETRSSELLKNQSAALKADNTSNMEDVVKPLRETLEKMEKALSDNKEAHLTSTEAIKEKIATLVATTMKVSTSAERLSNALTAESKTQGNWGEQKIETLLRALGLEEGLEYESQSFLRDSKGNIIQAEDSNKRMQPDIILHLDETRDLIVDSKVSLTAYTNYCNAEDEDARKEALALHLKSLRSHVKELAKKSYAYYVKPPRQSVDFVMMFVPIEGALQTANIADPTLWREAMEQGVFIVGEQNLYAAIRSVQETWKGIKQEHNQQEVFALAEELINRAGDFFEKYDEVGKFLAKACSAYDTAGKKLTQGQSVLGSAKKLVALGARENAKHPLPKFTPIEQHVELLEYGDDSASRSLPRQSAGEAPVAIEDIAAKAIPEAPQSDGSE